MIYLKLKNMDDEKKYTEIFIQRLNSLFTLVTTYCWSCNFSVERKRKRNSILNLRVCVVLVALCTQYTQDDCVTVFVPE